MSMRETICRFCKHEFCPSRYHPDQQVCSSLKCQQRRRKEYHRNKLTADPLYRQQCLDSQKKWRKKNPGYMKRYRAERARSVLLEELHRLEDLVKNNVVFDLQSSRASVWIVWPEELLGEKNSLASSKLIVLQAISHVVIPA